VRITSTNDYIAQEPVGGVKYGAESMLEVNKKLDALAAQGEKKLQEKSFPDTRVAIKVGSVNYTTSY
jgi:hypothetical protein